MSPASSLLGVGAGRADAPSKAPGLYAWGEYYMWRHADPVQGSTYFQHYVPSASRLFVCLF